MPATPRPAGGRSSRPSWDWPARRDAEASGGPGARRCSAVKRRSHRARRKPGPASGLPRARLSAPGTSTEIACGGDAHRSPGVAIPHAGRAPERRAGRSGRPAAATSWRRSRCRRLTRYCSGVIVAGAVVPGHREQVLQRGERGLRREVGPQQPVVEARPGEVGRRTRRRARTGRCAGCRRGSAPGPCARCTRRRSASSVGGWPRGGLRRHERRADESPPRWRARLRARHRADARALLGDEARRWDWRAPVYGWMLPRSR